MEAARPGFFSGLLKQQGPKYLWIGCADSRVPANELVDLDPGELFVHRNVANVVVHSDLNCLSVIQFATDVIKVRHIIVVGHSQCGGVMAALEDRRVGLADNWLRHVQDVRNRHAAWLETVAPADRVDALCELNVVEQALNVCQTTVVQEAWQRGQEIFVHGWVYRLHNGLLKDLTMTVSRLDDAAHRVRARAGAGALALPAGRCVGRGRARLLAPGPRLISKPRATRGSVRARMQALGRVGAQFGTVSDVPEKPIWSAAAGVALGAGTLAAVIAGAAPGAPPRGVARTTWLGGNAMPILR